VSSVTSIDGKILDFHESISNPMPNKLGVLCNPFIYWWGDLK